MHAKNRNECAVLAVEAIVADPPMTIPPDAVTV